MPSDQFASKASDQTPPEPVKVVPPADSETTKADSPPSFDERMGKLEARCAELETRCAELELAVASHAAPTLGELHDNHQILGSWFHKVLDRFNGARQPLPIVKSKEE